MFHFMKRKIVQFTLIGVLAMFGTSCLTDSSQKGSNATATQPKNEIWYTSKDGTIVEPNESLKRYISQVFGANIVSNTYEDAKGVIVFDADVKYIGMMAFKNNCNLTSISLPEDVTVINKTSFYGCTNLSSITIPWSVTDIGEYAFADCTSLTSIIIPDNVVKIGRNAFYNCTSLTSIYCKSLCPPSLGDRNVFSHVASDCKLYVPTTSVETYKEKEGWRKFYFNTVGYDFQHKATNKQSDSRKNEQDDLTEEYDIMLDEYAMKVDRLIDLIDDARNSNDALAPLAYASKIETLATECEKLHKKLKAAPLDKRQKLYKEEIEAELEDALRWFQYNY